MWLLCVLLLLALSDSVRPEFVSNDWPRVQAAAEALGSSEGIPVLLEVMANDQEVVLENTADLIYPGAKRFYGHGLKIDYELNWLSARSGWVLEAYVFEPFGFKLTELTDIDILNAVPKELRNKPPAELRVDPAVKVMLRARAVKNAQAWWKQQGGKFDRTVAARQILAGRDFARQVRVLNAIRAKQLPLEPYRDLIEAMGHSQDSEVRKAVDKLLR